MRLWLLQRPICCFTLKMTLWRTTRGSSWRSIIILKKSLSHARWDHQQHTGFFLLYIAVAKTVFFVCVCVCVCVRESVLWVCMRECCVCVWERECVYVCVFVCVIICCASFFLIHSAITFATLVMKNQWIIFLCTSKSNPPAFPPELLFVQDVKEYVERKQKLQALLDYLRGNLMEEYPDVVRLTSCICYLKLLLGQYMSSSTKQSVKWYLNGISPCSKFFCDLVAVWPETFLFCPLYVFINTFSCFFCTVHWAPSLARYHAP